MRYFHVHLHSYNMQRNGGILALELSSQILEIPKDASYLSNTQSESDWLFNTQSSTAN